MNKKMETEVFRDARTEGGLGVFFKVCYNERARESASIHTKTKSRVQL